MSSRCMSLLPLATLHSDSEQYSMYNVASKNRYDKLYMYRKICCTIKDVVSLTYFLFIICGADLLVGMSANFCWALLSNSEIYIPKNALAPTSLPNLKYKFPKQKYKILKSRRTYKLKRELYIFLYIYIFRNRKKSEWNL